MYNHWALSFKKKKKKVDFPLTVTPDCWGHVVAKQTWWQVDSPVNALLQKSCPTSPCAGLAPGDWCGWDEPL